jgi:hypothetical protein
MYQPNYGYQYPYYGTQSPMPDNLAQLRMNTNQIQSAVVQPSVPQPMQVQHPSNGLIWVQGESGAKSYLVAPNATVMLMDSEGERFYLKSADASGMPLPLRVFEYKERTEPAQQPSSGSVVSFDRLDDKFVTREEFEQLKASMASQTAPKKSKNNLTEVSENA